MCNISLSIEYDGTDYAGWQRQGRIKTVQSTIEKTLQKILQEKIRLIGSGRTDSGVHSLGQVANFKADSAIALDKLHKALNSLLPDDIAIIRIQKVNTDFHARFDAKSKIYRYTILNSKQRSVFLRNTTHFYPYSLDIDKMRKAAKCLLGRQDFKSFCASGSGAKNTIRTIKKTSIRKFSHPLYATLASPCLALPVRQAGGGRRAVGGRYPFVVIDIEADGFLYNMVRSIVGTLIEVGRGKITVNSFKKILVSRDRSLAGPTAPANGLCLIKVRY